MYYLMVNGMYVKGFDSETGKPVLTSHEPDARTYPLELAMDIERRHPHLGRVRRES